jgi:hypothetical protein
MYARVGESVEGDDGADIDETCAIEKKIDDVREDCIFGSFVEETTGCQSKSGSRPTPKQTQFRKRTQPKGHHFQVKSLCLISAKSLINSPMDRMAKLTYWAT